MTNAMSTSSPLTREVSEGMKMRAKEIANGSAAEGRYELLIELACNGMFGVGDSSMIAPPDEDKYFTLYTAELRGESSHSSYLCDVSLLS